MFPSVPLHTAGLAEVPKVRVGTVGSVSVIVPEAVPVHSASVTEKLVYVPAVSPLRANALPDTFTTDESAAPFLVNFSVWLPSGRFSVLNRMLPSVPPHTVGLVDVPKLSRGAEGSDRPAEPGDVPVHPLKVTEKPA